MKKNFLKLFLTVSLLCSGANLFSSFRDDAIFTGLITVAGAGVAAGVGAILKAPVEKRPENYSEKSLWQKLKFHSHYRLNSLRGFDSKTLACFAVAYYCFKPS